MEKNASPDNPIINAILHRNLNKRGPLGNSAHIFLNELLSLISSNDGKVESVPRDDVARQVAGFPNPARISGCSVDNASVAIQ